ERARAHAEMRGLRSEIEELRSRLEKETNNSSETSAEITLLRTQVNDFATERRIAEERLVALKTESEGDKKNLSAVSTNLSELSLQLASDQIQLDIQRQECEDLRAEIVTLDARIKELLPYERLHRVTDARSRKDAVLPTNGHIVEAAPRARRTSRRQMRA
ncbi:MAG: hypothetical protein E5Y12_32465, partial [Mesorhizobium sp.]